MNLFTYSAKSFRQHMGAGVVFIIALAIALLSAVLGIAASMQQSLYKQSVALTGSFHAVYNYVTAEQVEQIAEDERVSWSDKRIDLKMTGVIPGTDDPFGFQFNTNFKNNVEGWRLQWGHTPEKSNEAAVSPKTAAALGLKGKPGEAFKVTAATPQGTEKTFDFVLCGLLEDNATANIHYAHSVYISETLALSEGKFATAYHESAADDTLANRQVYVRFKDGVPIKEAALDLKEKAGVTGTEETDFRINEEYLRISLNDPGAMFFVFLVLGILLLTGILVIHGAFSIVVVKRSRQLGLLRLVGATKAQLAICVLLEGLFALLVSLPLGLLLGAGLVWLGLPACSAVMNNTVAVSVFMPPWTFGLTAALALCMVLLGTLAPAVKAGKITPVEAVQFTVPQEKSAKRKYTEDLSLSKLAQINLKRSKSRTRGILAALSISGILFLSICTLGFSMLDSVDAQVRATATGDLQIHAGTKKGGLPQGATEYQLTDALLKQLAAIDGVTRVDPFLSQFYKTIQEIRSTGILVGVSEAALTEALDAISGAPPIEAFRKPGTALALNWAAKFGAEALSPKSPGSTDPFLLLKNREGDNDGRTAALDILAIGDQEKNPFPIPFAGGPPTLVMLDETYCAMGFAQDYSGVSLYIDEAKHDEIMEAVTALLQPYDELYAESSLLKRQEMLNMLTGMLTLLFLIVFMIAVIGILNLVSATCIGIEQRQREFGVLYALGLGKRGIRSLLNRESLVISLKSIALSGILGLAAGTCFFLLMYYVAGNNSIRFSFPFVPFLGLCLLYGLAPRITAYFAARRMLRQTPTELLRQEQ